MSLRKNVPEVMKAGASGAALITAILNAQGPSTGGRPHQGAHGSGARLRRQQALGEAMAVKLTVNGKPRED